MTTVLERLGLSPQDDLSDAQDALVGRVVIMHGASADVIWQTRDGREDSALCSLSKQLGLTPVAGDWVTLSDQRITRILTRRSELRRLQTHGREPQVMAANIDLVMIVLAVNVDLNHRVLDRLSMMALDSGAQPVVVVTKSDDGDDVDAFCAMVREHVADVAIEITSSLTGEGIEGVRAHLPLGVTGVMLGASGVGKTSLLNALEGTSEFTRSVMRGGEGRHATTTRKLHRLSSGGVLLDIPGIRLLDVVADARSADLVFSDIDEIALACRFGNCRHGSDDGCAVVAAVESGELDAERLEQWRQEQVKANQVNTRHNSGSSSQSKAQNPHDRMR
jgi:ribosome biogenesis GTPase / thiamine phosphate phosphatase